MIPRDIVTYILSLYLEISTSPFRSNYYRTVMWQEP